MVRHSYSGFYYFMGLVLDIHQDENELVAALPGVPAGYEIRFEPLGGDRFRMHGGPLNQATAVFARAAGGDVTALQAGSFELAKIEPEALADLSITGLLLAPEPEFTPEKQAAFDQLLASTQQRRDGGWIDYELPYPRHEFVQYVTAQDAVIFHGSNNMGIDTFAPVRKSVELRDDTGRGNLQAVYGTHDGLWAMFFAVVDRDRLRGSIRNGVMYFRNRAGDTLAVYNFSVNQEQLAEKPWREGALYFLPREPFTRLKLAEEAYANEWACETAVRPLAKLRVRPEDFPFLDRVGGHDDGELLRLQTLREEIRRAARRAILQADRFSATLPAGMRALLEEYVSLQRTLMPAARFTVTPSGDEITLEIAALPPAFRQVLGETYADLLAG